MSVFTGHTGYSTRTRVLGLTALLLVGVPTVAQAAGKTSGGTTTCTRKCPTTDTTAPTVAISSPAGGSTVTSTVSIAGTAADNASLARVEVRLDGGSWVAATGTSSWSSSLSGLAAGSHTISARATDTSGNAATATVTVSVSAPAADTTAPTVSISSPTSGSTVNGNVMMTGTAADDAGVNRVDVQVDGGAWQAASGTSSWSAGAGSLAAGNHTLTARATDTAGNTSSSSVTVNATTTSTTTGADITLADPAATHGLALLGRGRSASWGDVTGTLYWESNTTRRAIMLRASSTGETAYVDLPVDNEVGWTRAAYLMTSGNDLWVFGGNGPMALRHFQLTGDGVPTVATLVSDQVFGDSDSRQGDFVRLSSGALLLSWMQQGASGPQGQWLAYQAAGSAGFQVTGPLQFVRTKASKAVLVQHPADGSIWLFSDPDAWGAIAAAHLSESGGALRVDWTDATWINSTTYGAMGPDPENPDLAAAVDLSNDTIVLAYQGAQRKTFTSGTGNATGSFPVIARIPSSGTPAFAQLPTYVERISSLGLTVRNGDVRLTYRPVDGATATFDKVNSSLMRDGSWQSATALGQMYTAWESLSTPSDSMQTCTRMNDGRLHLFTFA